MKKNLIATVLAVFMALPFVSCNKQNDKKESTKADAVENQAENENSAATENPKPAQENKDTLFVSESLRLRKTESTDSEILATMIIGTEVEVLEKGREETIGGVSGNWVKVRVLNDVEDLKGNGIQGISGWCFDGYLIEDATRFGLIGDWDSQNYFATFESDGDFILARKESEAMSGKWELKDKKILLSQLQIYDEEPTSDEWKLVNLDANNLQVLWGDTTIVFNRFK